MDEDIKTSDVMLGNLMQDQDGNILQVSEITEQNIVYTVVDRTKFPLKEGWKAVPISLSEEILLKFGFRKHKMYGSDVHFIYSLFIGGETMSITAIYNADFSILLHGNARKIKYAHDLQNKIKAVTGADLKVIV